MKVLQYLWLAGMVFWSGCIAGPTPHPSTNESPSEVGQDSGTGGNEPPGLGVDEDCKAQGGFWNGNDCEMASEPSVDASTVSDSSQDADELTSDTTAEGDGSDDASHDAVPIDG